MTADPRIEKIAEGISCDPVMKRGWAVTRLADAYAIFAAVAETRSISGAARRLGLPKANVSRAVSKLEATYQVALLDRAQRRLRLTEGGHALVGFAVRIRDEIADAESVIAAQTAVPAGVLRVGSATDIVRRVLAPRIREFIERYPAIDLRIQAGERLLPEPNALDVVLHAGWLADSALIVRKLVQIDMILVASAAYVERNGCPQTVGELNEHPVIGNYYSDRSSGSVGLLPARSPILELARNGKRHPIKVWSRFSTTDQMMLYELVKQGTAIAPVFKGRVAAAIHSGALVHVLPDYEVYDPPALYALYTDRAAVSPKLAVFLEFVADAARDAVAPFIPT